MCFLVLVQYYKLVLYMQQLYLILLFLDILSFCNKVKCSLYILIFLNITIKNVFGMQVIFKVIIRFFPKSS